MLVRRGHPVALGLALAGLVLAGCGDDARGSRPAAGEVERTVTLRVFAAASLTGAFTDLAAELEAAHPRIDVTLSFAGSSALAQQINAGAPVHVFASADEASMRTVTAAGARSATVFARNRLAILVEKGNPKRIRGLADLARRDLVVVLCAPAVPCGALAAAALRRAGVALKPASLEENVKAVASRVGLGEADAGIGYRTDATPPDAMVDAVDIDGADDPALQAVYSMAVLDAAGQTRAAEVWADLVSSERGQAVLRQHGFLPP